MTLTIWRCEHRLMGWRAICFPALSAAVLLAVALITRASGGADHESTILTGGLELGIPVAGGALTAGFIGVDPARELQLSLPLHYRGTLARRAALSTLWPAMTAVACALALIADRRWIAPVSGFPGQLAWAAPLFFATSGACALTVLARSHIAAAGVLATVAAGQAILSALFVRDAWLHPFYLLASTNTDAHRFWWSNRLWLVGLGVLALAVSWLALNRPERLLDDDQ